MAIQNNIVWSSIVLTCIKNLNKLNESSQVTITRMPGHAGVYGNEKADIFIFNEKSDIKIYIFIFNEKSDIKISDIRYQISYQISDMISDI